MEYESFAPPAKGISPDAYKEPVTISGSLRKGWDSGVLGAESQLHSLAGLAGEAMGADEFAANRNTSALRLRQEAQAAAPAIGKWDQVHDLRDFGNYAAGVIGGSAPVSLAAMGAGALTGGGAIPAMLAAGAVTAPFEMGDVIQKQQADPQAMQQSAGTRLVDAGLGGAASAAFQGVVPGIVGKQLVGHGAASMVGKSIKGTVAKNLAMDAALEGGAEGGGDALKQYAANQDAPLDWDSIKENTIGGAVGGGAMGTVGAAGQLAHSAAPTVNDAAGQAKLWGSKQVEAAKAAAAEKVDTAGETAPGKKVRSAYDDISDMVQRGKAKFDDTVSKVMKGEELGIDPAELATASKERIKEMFDLSDNEKVKAATKWGQDMLTKMRGDDPRRQTIEAADPTTRDGQVALAGEKEKFDKGEDASAKADAFSEAMGAKIDMPAATEPAKPSINGRKAFIAEAVSKGMTEDQARAAYVESLTPTPRASMPDMPEVPKLSADYSGANKAIADQLGPLLSRSQPDLAQNPRALATLADGLRRAVDSMPEKQLSSDAIFRLIDALGADTVPTLTKAWETLGTPAKTEGFYKNLNEIAELQQRTAKLSDLVGRSLTEASQKLIHPAQFGELTNMLLGRARGEGVNPHAGPHQQRAADAQFRSLMAEHFGDKADAISLAIEKEAGLGKGRDEAAPRAEGEFGADGERLEAAPTDTMKFGLSTPDAKGNSKSKLNGEAMAKDSRYTKQHIEDLKSKYPMHDVTWEKGEGSDLGHIKVERQADPDVLTTTDVESMRLDKKYPNSPNKITVGGVALDTKRIARVMDKRLEYSAADEQSRAHRMARMFNEGIARLMEQHGKFEVPDTAVIGQVGGKDLTFGEAKKLKSDTAKAENPRIAELRKEYRVASPQDRAEILAEIDDLKSKELSADPDAMKDSADETKQDAGKDGQIHEAARDNKPDDLINRSNMDGSARFTSDRSNMREALDGVANELKAKTSKVQQAIGDKLKALTTPETLARMAAKDLDALARLLTVKLPSERAAIINPLAEKYGKPVETVVKGAEPKPILSDAIAKRQEYLNNPPADYSSEKAKGILDWAASQKERVDAEYEKAKGGDAERQDQLSDYRSALGRLITKAKSVLEGDKSLEKLEGTPDPKAVAAKKAAFLERAASGDKALTKELSTSTDAKGLQRAIGELAKHTPDSEAMQAATKRLGDLVRADESVGYNLQTEKYSAEATDPTRNNAQDPGARAAIKDHIEKVLGKSVRTAWASFTHAGEYSHDAVQGIIRLSVHALDPMSTTYHESLHAFFAQLRDAGAHDITDVLERAAQSSHVLEQLTERFKNQPDVLKQLRDPEERAAYMYQMWAADPTFKISIAAKTVFGKIATFIRQALGLWSNDERALHIMEYFNSGEYARNMSSPSAVRHALMDSHRSQILETARSFTEPMAKLADAVVGMGGDRLRDTGVPALSRLADIMKREHTKEGGDQGFIQASRVEATKMRTQVGELLHGLDAEQVRDTMEALQSNTPASSPEARLAVREIKNFLAEARQYMVDAGVKIGNLGPDYFPRVWDTHYISKNQQAFRDMLEPYIRRGEMVGTADQLLSNLTNRGGVEFGIESRESNQPGMQFKKERLLDFITPQDAAQFMEKNLHATLSSYVNQAARKAEWTRRLGNGKMEQLLADAKTQGATKEHLATAEQYMKGIDGTLGDNLNPHARRIMGNMIVYQNVRLLPTAAFSMLIDPVGVVVRGGTVADAWSTFTRGMAGIKDTFKKDGGEAAADQATKWAELVGVVDSAMMSHAMGDVFSQGMVGGTAQKINNTFFKYNLVEGLNRNFRVGATEAAIKFLTAHADGKASAHSARWMKELGVQNGDIKLVGAHIALTEAEGLQAAQVRRVHAAINQWVDGAILRPDAADKPIWMNDPHYALISHLKQFVFSFQKTILARTMHEMKHGNYTPVMALASYVPIMMAADMAKGLLVEAGGTPEWKKGWGPADYLENGVERAGLYGVGQFGVDIAKDFHRGGTGIGALAGPTFEQLGDVVSTLGGHKQFGNTVLDALPANTFVKGWSGRGEAKADPIFGE